MDLAAFRREGALRFEAVFDPAHVAGLQSYAAAGPGTRLRDARLPARLAPATAIASQLLGGPARPVRAVLFDKTPETNWAVAWHQDRTIPVEARVETPGFHPWSRKDGGLHVMPPIDVLERMATLRIHLDPCGTDNAPLKIALGSHRLGRVPAREAAGIATAHTQAECLAETGDVWAYSTPILHASDRARKPSRRRVLQVDYAAFDLPGGLVWSGVGAAR